jgi:magnesium and cobalt transporter
MGHVPRRGEHFDWMQLRFEVLHTKAGAVKWFKVYPVALKESKP